MDAYTTPSFLEGYSADEIYARMRAELPADIDSSEGSHVWNFLRPTALVAAELCESLLPQVIQVIFPDWSYAEFLDGHAKARGLTRRPAVAASGTLTITGTVGAVIPLGTRFSTAAAGDTAAVEYATTEEVTIGDGGTASAPVTCTEAGTVGNTGPGTVILVSGRLPAVTDVTNPAAITGGAAEESDESLRERISSYDRNQGNSFVGSLSDYHRWATSVAGVGSASVIDAQDDTGTVTIIVSDTDGNPATEELRQAVYDYIMSPDDPGSRLAPVNATIQVIAPTTLNLVIRATVSLEFDATTTSARNAFLQNLAAYLPTALDEGEVKYTRVAACLSAAEGVSDYTDLQIGIKSASTQYGTDNIPISSNEVPAVESGDIDLTEATA